MEDQSVWLGSSSGLGKAVVEHALSKGDKVSATCRNPDDLSDLQSKYPATQLIVVRLDVTSPEQVASAFTQTIEAFGRVDVVYNNAGFLVIGETESTPDEIARLQFEVNFWGVVSVSKEAVRVFRDVNRPVGGVLLQASSYYGTRGYEGAPFYCASKFALEGLSEALSREVDPSWNIRIRIVNIGGFATRVLTKASSITLPPHPAYAALPEGSQVLQNRLQLSSNPPINGDPAKAAREIYSAAHDTSLTVLRIPLGPEPLEVMAEKAREYMEVVSQTAKYSVDVEFD